MSFGHNNLEGEGWGEILCEVLQRKNCNIVKIDLPSNKLKPEFGKVLGEGLKNNHSVRYVDLMENVEFGDDGVIDLCNGLVENESLFRIRVGGCDLTDKVK